MHRTMSLVICSLLLVSTVTAYSDAVQRCLDEDMPTEEVFLNIVYKRLIPDTMITKDKCFLKCVAEKALMLHEITGEWHEATVHEDMVDEQKVAITECLGKVKVEDKCEEVFQILQCYKYSGAFHLSDAKHKKIIFGAS